MNIRIIKNAMPSLGKRFKGHYLLETAIIESDIEFFNKVKYYIYDIDTNTKEEIAAQINKYQAAIIHDMSIDSKNLYFTSCEQIDNKIKIDLQRCDLETKKIDCIYSFEDEIEIYQREKRIKIFILNDNYILVQNELLRSNLADNYEGFFEFEQYLYNLNDKSIVQVLDENLSNNGISRMWPISEKLCVIKTGYQLLEDNRYKKINKNEASVEGVSFINISQLISDINLKQRNIIIDTIDQAYFNKTIPYVRVEDDFVIYSKVNLEDKTEELIFYNFTTKEMQNCINKNAIDIDSLAKPYIISKQPYIRIDKKEGTQFFNLKKTKIDIKLKENENIVNVLNDVFIIATKSKRFLSKKENEFINVYKMPNKQLILREKGEYLNAFRLAKDDIYVFTKRKDT